MTGNDSPKETDGNDRSEILETAPEAEKKDLPNVPPAWTQAGTIGQGLSATTGAGFSKDKSYCSQNPLSSAGNEIPDPRDAGGFNWQTGEQDPDWEEVE